MPGPSRDVPCGGGLALALEQRHDPGGGGRIVEHRSVPALHGEDLRTPRFEERDLVGGHGSSGSGMR